jgi:hypothetical protein
LFSLMCGVGQSAGGEVAVRERGWNIIRVDGDGAVRDAARQSGHWASPLFCAQWRAATVGGNSAW